MDIIKKIYDELFMKYGPKGWWPIVNEKTMLCEHHPGDYSYPKTDNQKFEICVGAILTQNTAWINVEKALVNLQRANALSVKSFRSLSHGKLKELIKPAGYFNQKAKKLRIFSEFFLGLKGRTPKRHELLKIWGIGPETADSILLYAYEVPTFVVDAYTKRVLMKEGLVDEKATYDEMKKLFEDNLEKDYKLFQEYHALIVEEGKKL